MNPPQLSIEDTAKRIYVPKRMPDGTEKRIPVTILRREIRLPLPCSRYRRPGSTVPREVRFSVSLHRGRTLYRDSRKPHGGPLRLPVAKELARIARVTLAKAVTLLVLPAA
jgi:hypothetical protein